MFGYVTANKMELKMKDFYRYKAFYCGLCGVLKERYGRFGQLTLTYDMTFLILLLTSLYECETVHEVRHCLVHPVKKHDMLSNEITEYAAAMNIALSYHHFRDDWADEKSIKGAAFGKLLEKRYHEVESRYDRQCQAVRQQIGRLSELERKISSGELLLSEAAEIDNASGCFGTLMAEILVYRKDQFEQDLRDTGFYLGKYIYLMDAYDDIDRDSLKGNYNPLKRMHERQSFEEECERLLTLMISECSSAFEKLPLLQDAPILRNILYAGAWEKYDKIRTERMERTKE